MRRFWSWLIGTYQGPQWADVRDERTVDVHSFRAVERLKVHEARTEAENGSCVLRSKPAPMSNVIQMNLQTIRPAKRKAA